MSLYSRVSLNFQKPNSKGKGVRNEAAYIVDRLNMLNPLLNLHADDILQPTHNRLYQILEIIVHHLFDIPESMPIDLSFRRTIDQDLESYSVFYTKSVVFKLVSSLISDLTNGHYVFALNDWLHPTDSAIRLVLLTLVEYIALRNVLRNEVEEIFHAFDEEVATRLKKEKELKMLKQQCDEQLEKVNERKQLENELQEELKGNLTLINEICEQNASLKEEFKRIERLVTQLEATINDLKIEYESGVRENEIIRGNIVESPERLHDETAHLENLLKKFEDLLGNKRNEFIKSKANLRAIEEEVSAISIQIERMISLDSRKREKTIKVSRFDEHCKEESKIQSDLNALRKDKRHVEDQILDDRTAFERKMDDFLAEIQSYRNRLVEIRRHIGDQREDADASNKKKIEIHREISQLKIAHSAERREIENQLMKLCCRLDGSAEKLDKMMFVVQRNCKEVFLVQEQVRNAFIITTDNVNDGQSNRCSRKMS